jgi:hypothetical protein
MHTVTRSIVVDPSSVHYFENKLFDISNSILNRDGTLLPFHRLQAALQSVGISLNTVDLLLQGKIGAESHDYYSLGMLANIPALEARKDIVFKGFLIMEPPIVAPELYAALPELSRRFEKVYVHNTIGDGYSLSDVDQPKLRKLYWPQPNFGVIEPYWSNSDRLNRVVVINGNHKPKMRRAELYSKRIEAMVALADLDAVDLYGRGWQRWWAASSLWLPYWLNLRKLMLIYRGECPSKYEVLSQYRFCLCFENMEMTGYVTEKIFDCLYVGTIPVYWGAPDINELIPSEAYIDARKYSSFEDVWSEVSRITMTEINDMRDAGRLFLNSPEFLKYQNSLHAIFKFDMS